MSLEGTGQAHGALTAVNAIPTGHGAAIGLELSTTANVEIDRTDDPVTVTIGESEAEDPSLARACVATVADHLGTPLSGSVRTRSQIPIACGLKSSSVAANAITLALLDALDEPAEADLVLQLAVEAARRAEVTITGALDDAAASLLGGLVVTNNLEDRVVKRKGLDACLPVLLLVPERRRYTAETGDLSRMAQLADHCLELVDDDAWALAMTLNGLGVAAVLDDPTDPIYRAMAAGAVAAGTSGTGPAVAAVSPEDATTAVRQAWQPYTATVLATRTTNAASPGVIA